MLFFSSPEWLLNPKYPGTSAVPLMPHQQRKFVIFGLWSEKGGSLFNQIRVLTHNCKVPCISFLLISYILERKGGD